MLYKWRIWMISICFVFATSTFICLTLMPNTIEMEGRNNEKQIFLAILVISRAENFHHRQTIRETWGRNLNENISLYFVVSAGPGIDDEKRKHNDLLVLGNIEDTYELLTSKTLGAFSSILENTSFEYLLKCDDDSYVFIDKLINLLAKQPSKKLYLGYFKGNAHVQRKGAWKEKDWNLCDRYLPYAQGGGYLLSKDLVEYIVKNSDLLKKYKSEDVSVGAWLAPLDINKVHDIRFNTEWRSRGCSNSDVITHKQSPTMMLKMFQNLNAIGYPCSTEIKERQAYEYNWTVLPSHCCNNFI
ncbi:beta-1,3-galactosyltransferase 6-like [Artemia franciscana]|uniref:Hexosyltransferase n=1 Tax=Artemia franciscana TaxID=6661 RepID=A0AA88KXL3_ARTSF|nr:hypothetical protein QYM36_016107 [Artemia franciscana]